MTAAECALSLTFSRNPRPTMEPDVVRLTEVESEMVDELVEMRLARDGGEAEAARAAVVREVVAAGLLAVRRAEGRAT